MTEEKKTKLSYIEQFGLVSGVIGLVLDGIALTTFLFGVWDLEQETQELFNFHIASLLLLFYGWLTISWALTRRGLNSVPLEKRAMNVENLSGKSTLGTGFGIIPLFIMWLATIISKMINPTYSGPFPFSDFLMIIAGYLPYIAIGGIIIFVVIKNLIGLFHNDLREYKTED